MAPAEGACAPWLARKLCVMAGSLSPVCRHRQRIECGVPIAAHNLMAIASGGGGQEVGRKQALHTLVRAVAAGHAFNSAHSELSMSNSSSKV